MTSPTPTEISERIALEWDAWCARIYIARRAAEKAARYNILRPELQAA